MNLKYVCNFRADFWLKKPRMSKAIYVDGFLRKITAFAFFTRKLYYSKNYYCSYLKFLVE